jgi:uncharacterized protein DUF6788
MPEAQDPQGQTGNVSPTPAQRAQAARITAAIAEIGFILPGTLTERLMRCGHPTCRCHADPPALHGPYHQWTRKVAGKTITRFLSDDQLANYGDWFDNQRRLRQLIGQLEALSLAIVEADPRSKKRRRQARPGDTRQTST